MSRIECPSGKNSTEGCNWEQIPGRVRDVKDVGVKQCSECFLVTHGVDLSAQVNYEAGSMHDWAAGYGDTLSGPHADSNRRVDKIQKLRPAVFRNRILDFGCGDGSFLDSLDSTWEKFGLEPDLESRKSASKGSTQIFDSAESVLQSKLEFDVISLFHVVEHFYKPSAEFELIYKLLAPGGLLVIETPNSQDALLTKYESTAFREFTYWSHHPMLHSKQSLEKFVLRSGFKIIESIGIQRYGLKNHLNWLVNGTPGGHIGWSSWISNETEIYYEADLQMKNANDTLWIVATKSINRS
jgi:2-polyprenyl-3-methyl-5-hydroxy-6-metoxy-1,4-benzoquinol methylase